MTKEEAFKKGYLEKGKLILKPIERGGKMITDKSHVGYFMFDGASVLWSLPVDSKGILTSPFKSEEERKFFEEQLDVDLNVHKKTDNFWNNFYVRVTKDASFMLHGVSYDLSDPMDNLRARILKMQNIVAVGWENRYSKPEYRFVLVPEDFEDAVVEEEMDKAQVVWTYWGSIKNNPNKIKDFLYIYLISKKSTKELPRSPSKEFLVKEASKIIKEDKQGVYDVITDDNTSIKLFITKAISVGAIHKVGVNKYNISGEDVNYTLQELINYMKKAEETTDDVFLKIKAQIEIDNT